jgi:NAD-specific glutamate dehydrogenase
LVSLSDGRIEQGGRKNRDLTQIKQAINREYKNCNIYYSDVTLWRLNATLNWRDMLLLRAWRKRKKYTTISQSQSYTATDGQSVSKSWCRAPSGADDQILIITV